jgi:penicillin V acylase-like amidase (Ntn superfamily)
VSTRSPASAASRWSIKAMRPLPATPVHVREACTSRAAASSDAEKIAGRIVEYGTAVEEANWSML